MEIWTHLPPFQVNLPSKTSLEYTSW